jgi:hypothetical protein
MAIVKGNNRMNRSISGLIARRFQLVQRALLPVLALVLGLIVVAPPAARAAGSNCTVNGAGGADYTTIQAAVDDTGCTTITVAAGTYREHVAIGRDLSISGAGASSTTVDGTHSGRVFTIIGATVTLHDLTIANGTVEGSPGGGIINNGTLTVSNSTLTGNAARTGGGIFNYSTLTVSNSTLADNSASNNGGGIANVGTLTVSNSTLAGNSASGEYGYGGGIDNGGTLTVSNSTLAGNSASGAYGYGGGIINSGTLTASNSTLAGNSAYDGGGISSYSTLTMSNSIIANSLSGGDCLLYIAITDSGGNIADGNCHFTAASSRNNTDPKLDPNGLQNNGGPTKTIALLPGSPAIDAAVSCPPPATDQRGIARPQGSGCDIGAYEVAADQTPPQITPTVVGTLGNNGWYVSDVTVNWSVLDNESTIISQSGCATTNVTSDTNGETFTCSATSAGGTSSQSVTIKRDATAPSGISATASRAPNANGWYNASVSFTFSGTDATSGIDTCTPTSYSGPDSASATVSGNCTDQAGNTSAAVASSSFKYDATAPSLAPSVSPNPVVLNGSASASPNATDNLSGVADASCGALTTSSVGTKSASCSATDMAGNTANANASYTVIYNFSGFFSPVANAPTLNQVSGGSSVALTFGLSGNQGLNILAANFPASRPIDCKTLAPLGNGSYQATNPSGKSGFTYSATTNQYTYSWKTDKAWANTCRQFDLKLIDGTEHLANFRFK